MITENNNSKNIISRNAKQILVMHKKQINHLNKI